MGVANLTKRQTYVTLGTNTFITKSRNKSGNFFQNKKQILLKNNKLKLKQNLLLCLGITLAESVLVTLYIG
jgi:hypothetical protein